MALDLSKFKISFKFFNQLDARARIFVLIAGVLGILFLVYLITIYFYGDGSSVGPSRVATAPQNLQSIPGGQLTPEYYRALSQANAQAAQQAQITGGSAVPTLVNVGDDQPAAPISNQGQCSIICADQVASVKPLLDKWVKEGKITPEVMDQLDQLAKKNPAVDAYASTLNEMVKQKKLTPEQARELLEQYKKQHKDALLEDSASRMDGMIQSGQLPLSSANELLAAQRDGESTSDYAARLQKMVDEGKISQQTAQQLLAQYTQQRAREVTMQSIAILQQWGREGKIMPDIEKQLIDLENKMVSLSTFESEVKNLVSQGKLAPVVAEKVIDEYKAQKAAIGPTTATSAMVQKAEGAAFQELDELLRDRKITQDTAQIIAGMITGGVTQEQFNATISKLVTDNKLTPDIAKLKIADYQAILAARDMARRLNTLQANNASATDYASALKNAVASGLLTPDEAADLMQQYQAITARSIAPAATDDSSSEFAQLQRNLQQGSSTPTVSADQFVGSQTAVTQESEQERAQRLQAMIAAMSGQAQQLVAAWQPSKMEHTAGEDKKKSGKDGSNSDGSDASTASSSSTSGNGDAADANTPALIKAGTIEFAVLDTAINSDYPDSPVMATVVAGKYKGAKLLGKLMTTKSTTGQLDRVTLNFTLMNIDEWPQSKSVTAFAIDPDTARTALASNVNYHYMQRYAAIMASSFIEGYANAVSTSGATTGIGLNGTQTQSNPAYSPTDKLAIGIGQVGQSLTEVFKNYTNRPPTVRVDSGVSLGILFMSDVT